MGKEESPYGTAPIQETGKKLGSAGRGTSPLTRLGFCEAMRKTDLGHRDVNRGCSLAHTCAHMHMHRGVEFKVVRKGYQSLSY